MNRPIKLKFKRFREESERKSEPRPLVSKAKRIFPNIEHETRV